MIRTTIAAAALAGGMMLAPGAATAHAPSPYIPPCDYEDGSGQRICVWDAHNAGNGRGDSFIALRGGTDRARYIYINGRLARHLTR